MKMPYKTKKEAEKAAEKKNKKELKNAEKWGAESSLFWKVEETSIGRFELTGIPLLNHFYDN